MRPQSIRNGTPPPESIVRLVSKADHIFMYVLSVLYLPEHGLGSEVVLLFLLRMHPGREQSSVYSNLEISR